MTDEDETRRAELFEEAVRTYLVDAANAASVPDRATSIVSLGDEPRVALRDSAGLPLGTVTWERGVGAVFEPPTRVTVVDHVRGLRHKE
jgi:hypothetical protein